MPIARTSTLCASAGLALAATTMVLSECGGGTVKPAVSSEAALPKQEPPFHGVITETYRGSRPDFPAPVTAPRGAPNVLLVLLDDIGFGQPGTFGGPIPTPHLDKVASEGLRYNEFHTTALCSPTRAALLTGRNHHAVGMGTITELASGYPGYDTVIPKSAATIAQVLRDNGYNTAAFGKWHVTPDFETGPTGPFDRWPSGLGFETFYGFHGGETSQYSPQLYKNNFPVEAPRTPEQGYTLNEDLADNAVAWLEKQKAEAPDKPFFVYFATGGVHAPHHVPRAYIERFKGKFDQGWDKQRELTFQHQKEIGIIPQGTKLTPRPKEIPAWDSLSADRKRLFARMQEVFAGFVAQTDEQVGRVVDSLDRLGIRDNTLVIYVVGDNGPSAEGTLEGTLNAMASQQGVLEPLPRMLAGIDDIGSPKFDNHYPVGWAWAGSAPFQWMKQVASHFGGTRNGMIVTWPKRITDPGSLRSQFHHVIDIAPTIYEAVGVTQPAMVNGIEQKPIDGTSLLYTLDKANANARSRHTVQYFEMFGNRALYRDGWVAAARHGRVPWMTVGGASGDFDHDKWELYDVDHDFSQATDLAAQNPAKLAELEQDFDQEARKHNVYPLDDRFAERAATGGHPSPLGNRTSFTYYPGAVRIPEGSAPSEKGRSYRVAATVTVPERDTDGVLVTSGGQTGGYALYVKNRRPVFEYNYFGFDRYTIASPTELRPGDAEVAFEFRADKPEPGTGGTGRLLVNGQVVAEGRFEHTVPFRNSATETFDVGEDTGTPVSAAYHVPFPFAGTLKKVQFDYLQ